MKISYDPQADILLISLSDAPPVDALEEPGGIIISYDEANNPVSIEFLNATKKQLIQDGEVRVSFQTIGSLSSAI